MASDASKIVGSDASKIVVSGKISWPELVGTNGDEAVVIIERENPKVKATILLDGTPAIGNYVSNRVRVWVNEQRVVIQTPQVG